MTGHENIEEDIKRPDIRLRESLCFPNGFRKKDATDSETGLKYWR